MSGIARTDKLLFIVESPNKVKTIAGILNKAGYVNATVLASIGHIMELKDGGSAFNSGIFPDKQFKLNLSVAAEKQKVVSAITEASKVVDKILIATDGDREGELIAWSLIKFCNLPKEKCFRIVFHEITQTAVVRAIENPNAFNDNLVYAGLTRLMLDKLIGYGLSPLCKKYIGAKSIGRCQSVGLKLISDREKEINEFIPELYFNIYLDIQKYNQTFCAKYIGYKDEQISRFNRQADVDAVINNCNKDCFIINSVDNSVIYESPKPAFCTATFQQEAANKLGLRVKDAMSCAQKLFEGIKIDGEHKGLITYMRTDSTDIADDFLPILSTFINSTYSASMYVGPRKNKKQQKSQNGHEALRVVDPAITPDILAKYINNELLIKVYKLIWQRTIASVMKNATIACTSYTIENNGHKFSFDIKTVKDYGFRLVYHKQDEEHKVADIFSVGESLENVELRSSKNLTSPKPRFTEASLVKELQLQEIGRPSTYATIVETILSVSRGYAKLEEKCIVPTDRGVQLAEYCDRAFPTIINLKYSKDMEDSLDKIADGKVFWLDFIENFYNNLKTIIESTTETGIITGTHEKRCPNCNSALVVRRSRFGKLFYGCTSYPKCSHVENFY